MTAQQLKNSILQMAVQGKLVPQAPTDEPASVLLERIRTEKEKLIKEGKIKKEKNPSVIFRGVDLCFQRTHFHRRIQQAGGANDQFRNMSGTVFFFKITGRSGNKNGSPHHGEKFFKLQWTVIQCRGQTESVIHQHLFPAAVCFIHRL